MLTRRLATALLFLALGFVQIATAQSDAAAYSRQVNEVDSINRPINDGVLRPTLETNSATNPNCLAEALKFESLRPTPNGISADLLSPVLVGELRTTIATHSAHLDKKVKFRLLNDTTVDSVSLPAGTMLEGRVTKVISLTNGAYSRLSIQFTKATWFDARSRTRRNLQISATVTRELLGRFLQPASAGIGCFPSSPVVIMTKPVLRGVTFEKDGSLVDLVSDHDFKLEKGMYLQIAAFRNP